MRTLASSAALVSSILVAACGGSGDTAGASAGPGGVGGTGAGGKAGSGAVAGHGGTSGNGAAGKAAGAGASVGGGAGASAGSAGASAGTAGASAGGGKAGGGAGASAGGAGGTNAGGTGGANAGGTGGANAGGASGASGAFAGGASGSGGNGSCVDGQILPCGTCNVGTATCKSGAYQACVLPTPAPDLKLTATIRDFHAFVLPDGSMNPMGHPDFENANGAELGIVEAALGPDGKPVYAKAGQPSLTTHGKMYFDQWYNDVPGVNMSKDLTFDLTLVPGSSPAQYGYDNQAFFPIDNMLWGNEGYSHNYGFTVELHTKFRYLGGEKFSFTGDDDVFVFLNGKLALDLGGVHGAESGAVDLDAMASELGITACNVYEFALFYNERHTVASDLALQTTLALTDKPLAKTPVPAARARGRGFARRRAAEVV